MTNSKASGPLWATKGAKEDIFPETVREHKIWGDDIPCRLVPGHGRVVPLELVEAIWAAWDDSFNEADANEGLAGILDAIRAAIEGAL